MNTNQAISVKNLSRSFYTYDKRPGLLQTVKSIFKRNWREVYAVNNISFQISRGSFVGFLGPNGAGKTTTLKMLSGIISKTSGICNVLGYDPSERKRAFKKQISIIMGQRSQLIWDLPAMESFCLHRDLYEIDQPVWKKKLDMLIEMLNLSNLVYKPVRQLSLGERMKSELVISMLHSPQVIFLDEPTIGLDILSQEHVWKFLRDIQKKEGTTIMLTSHYIQDITNLCPRVIVINKGGLTYDGALESLVKIIKPLKRIFIKFDRKLSKDNIEMITLATGRENFEKIDDFSCSISVAHEDFKRIVGKIFSQFQVEDFHSEETDLSYVINRSYQMPHLKTL